MATIGALCTAVTLPAQDIGADGSRHTDPARSWRRDAATFVAGAATALVAHESGHLAADAAFGAHVTVRRVTFGGIPFFAVAHAPTVTRRQEYVISSAGFWVQHATSERILTRATNSGRAPGAFARGVLAFNVLTSVGYAGAAFARRGPAERDTRSIAVGLGVREPVVGALVLTPALLDAWRYRHPDQRGVAWLSRGVKVSLLVLTVRARDGRAP